MRLLTSIAFLLAAGFAAAEDKKPNPAPKGEAVSGKVALDGIALSAATITFASKDGKTTASAEVKDGAYTTTMPADEYGVGITSAAAPKEKDPKTPPKILPVVPAKYGDPKTSGISVKVAAGKNELNFELKSK